MLSPCCKVDRAREKTMSPRGVPRTQSVSPVQQDPINAAPQPISTCLPSIARLSHPTNYYNPAKQGLYPRYSQCDWDSSFAANVRLAEKERHKGEKIRADSWRLVSKTEFQARSRQCANTKRLGERAYDISFWKEELIKEISVMETEILNLKESQRIVEVSLEQTRCSLKIAEECLLQREKRTGIDQIRDEVEKCLTKEILLQRKAIHIMEQLIQKADIQLKLNRHIQHACDLDVRDKHHSQNIDERMEQIRNTTFGIVHHPGIEYADDTITTVRTWIKFSQENLRRSQNERECSERLRGQIDTSLRALANQLWNQYNNVNFNFSAKMTETNNTKSKLQENLLRTNNEILDMEKNIEILRRGLDEKDAFLRVAQTRLEERTRRMNIEMCHDRPMTGLQIEVEELRRSLEMIRRKLHDSQMSLCRLLKTRNALQMDIAIKDNTIQLDLCCIAMRKNMAMDPCVGLVFNMPQSDYLVEPDPKCS